MHTDKLKFFGPLQAAAKKATLLSGKVREATIGFRINHFLCADHFVKPEHIILNAGIDLVKETRDFIPTDLSQKVIQEKNGKLVRKSKNSQQFYPDFLIINTPTHLYQWRSPFLPLLCSAKLTHHKTIFAGF